VSTLKTRNIREALSAKGFRESPNRDHCYLFFYLKGKKSSVFTKMSHGKSEVGDGLISSMAKQVKLNKSQFQGLVECSLTADKYAELLISGGHVAEVKD
jgi:predicted RNA binding protein YcfA (HicA-like mRNA interferase family)